MKKVIGLKRILMQITLCTEPPVGNALRLFIAKWVTLFSDIGWITDEGI
ncbi:hypothetical protein BZ17_595 [Yersinia pseudotuberculosis IP 32953]|nr:hypothetical protein BZ21_1146 [Yersinia pseudotuberculosis]AJJ55602.1 hypothetical protein BZ17_595 [Yersinia pseudotuberculosis IP 32953]AJJ68667.1 hypothetical protein BZ16_1224 [Yersinia pseudotuberculosis PB1/+]CQD53114.1 Uncharacterised protein [Yersinia intermedia]AJJ71797.1 hypothetical protein BZ23_1429 [Yersinia pseudotuberculosis]